MEVTLDEDIFNAASYDLNIPSLDGHRATNLEIRFAGSGRLDRTSEDDLALLEAMRLGLPVRLLITGEINGKSYKLGADNEELAFACTVKVLTVEAGEIA